MEAVTVRLDAKVLHALATLQADGVREADHADRREMLEVAALMRRLR